MPAPNRIFIRLPNWLGDLLMARPLLHALRGALPSATLAGVAPAALLDLLEADGSLDERHAWPREAGARRRVVAALVSFDADVALVLPPSFSSAWLAWQSRAKARVGFAHEHRGLLLTRTIRRFDRGDRHLADEYVDLAREWVGEAVGGCGAAPPLGLSAATRAAGRRVAEDVGANPRAFAVMAPGASYGPAKRWPAERFVEVGRRLSAAGLRVLACGTREESGVCESVAREIGSSARSLAGGTSLPELAGLCAEARIAVCNDSGLAHLCAALAVPTVAVFGSTSSAWTAPQGRAVRVVQHAPVCSPCFRRDCSIGMPCLTGVTAGRVWRACEGLLEASAA